MGGTYYVSCKICFVVQNQEKDDIVGRMGAWLEGARGGGQNIFWEILNWPTIILFFDSLTY